MTSPTLTELAERVERLTGPCREMDGLIYRSIDPVIEQCWKFWSPAQLETIVPRYTASLDAAMTLARTPQEAYQAVQDAISAIAKRDGLHCNFYRGSFTDDLARQVSATLLRARAASESSHG